MPLTKDQKSQIQQVITTCLRNKFQHYKPENNYMPFHFRLLGKDRLALYSFMQSLLTTFGTSIFEPVAAALAKMRFAKVETQFVFGNSIFSDCQKKMQSIINQLTINPKSNKITPNVMLRRMEAKHVNEI